MFERLTNYDYVAGIKVGDLKTGINQEKAFDRLAQYEDSGLSPEEVMQLQTAYKAIPKGVTGEPIYTTCFGIPLSEIEEWVRAKADGRLVVLPCKVGDEIFSFKWSIKNEKYEVHTGKVKNVRCNSSDGLVMVSDGEMYRVLGKTVFLTRAEAEAVVKGDSHE